MTVQPQHVHLLVKRNPWEPKHEWESRIKFVEDNVERFGLQRAINLSMVWANVHFLGCSYPSHTQELVAYYPLPDRETLKMERKKRERMERKRRDSREGEAEGTESKPTRKGQNESEVSLEARRESQSSSVEEADTSFEQVSLQVNALISAIRKQHEKQAGEGGRKSDLPREVLKMIKSMCMCGRCFCPNTSPCAQVNSIVQRYVARIDSDFRYDFHFSNSSDGSVVVCQLTINGELVSKAEDENRKVAKQQAANNFLSYVENYYKEHGTPCCPNDPKRI